MVLLHYQAGLSICA